MNNITEKFLSKPYTIRMGKNKLAEWWGTTPEIVQQARKAAKIILKSQCYGRLPRILLFDIETSPLKASVFQKQVWRANITDEHIISEWFMLSWSAKWLDETITLSDRLNSKEALDENDERIVRSLWILLDEADIVITHNGDRFDLPNMNTRFIVHGMKPTRAYKTIDTLRVSQKQFGFTHNSLNGLAKVFGFEPKMHTSLKLWKDCVDGKEDALIYMEKYNKYDVELLEEVYLKLRPWMWRHPNLGLYMESENPVCPKCGSVAMKSSGFYYTSVSKFETLTCQECGSLARRRQNVYPKELRKNLLTTLAY
jgi:DNA polymerase elongation subunit (family B)